MVAASVALYNVHHASATVRACSLLHLTTWTFVMSGMRIPFYVVMRTPSTTRGISAPSPGRSASTRQGGLYVLARRPPSEPCRRRIDGPQPGLRAPRLSTSYPWASCQDPWPLKVFPWTCPRSYPSQLLSFGGAIDPAPGDCVVLDRLDRAGEDLRPATAAALRVVVLLHPRRPCQTFTVALRHGRILLLG